MGYKADPLVHEISADLINAAFCWLPNDAALPLVNPEICDKGSAR